MPIQARSMVVLPRALAKSLALVIQLAIVQAMPPALALVLVRVLA
jgi:hypothetical protein